MVGGQYIQNDKTKVDNPVLLSILLFYFKVQYLFPCSVGLFGEQQEEKLMLLFTDH